MARTLQDCGRAQYEIDVQLVFTEETVFESRMPMTLVGVKIELPELDDDLLRECEVNTFRSSGPGGQHVNKTESAVRIKHLATGVVVTSRSQRSQHQNKARCLQELRRRIERMNRQPPKRIQTRVPRNVKIRMLEAKTRRSRVKQLRAKPRLED